MMKQLLFILLFFLGYFAKTQPPSTLPFEGNQLTTDQFGFYYEIRDVEINKYNAKGKLNSSYSNNMLGVIASVDVSNPYKILVYFKDFTKVLILDNFLSPTSDVIDLTQLELEETNLVCRSYNDGIWYYDPIRFELTRKNQALQTTNTSGNLANVLNLNIEANFLVEYNNRVYLNTLKSGILVFDNFGNYLKTIPIFGLTSFQVKDKYLIYANTNSVIEVYNFFTLAKTTFKPKLYKTVNAVRLEGNTLFIQNEDNQLIIDKIEE